MIGKGREKFFRCMKQFSGINKHVCPQRPLLRQVRNKYLYFDVLQNSASLLTAVALIILQNAQQGKAFLIFICATKNSSLTFFAQLTYFKFCSEPLHSAIQRRSRNEAVVDLLAPNFLPGALVALPLWQEQIPVDQKYINKPIESFNFVRFERSSLVKIPKRQTGLKF